MEMRQHNLFCTLDVSSCLPCRAYALRDYYPFWKSHQERSTAGKRLCLQKDCMQLHKLRLRLGEPISCYLFRDPG